MVGALDLTLFQDWRVPGSCFDVFYASTLSASCLKVLPKGGSA